MTPRPASPAATDAILAATIALVAERGYERTSLEAIAAHAQVGKATLYRRWPDKAALMKAALDRYDAGRMPAIPDTGSLRGDLLALVAGLAAVATPAHIALMHGLATAMRCDPALAAALQAHVADEEQAPLPPLVARAVARGDLASDARAAAADEVLEGLLIRRIQLGQPLDEPFALHVVDEILVPFLCSPS